MSTETATSKKSILTTAMEKVAAKKAANDSDETTPVTDEVAAKRLLKKAGIALVGTVAVVTAVIVISNRSKTEDETSPEATPED